MTKRIFIPSLFHLPVFLLLLLIGLTVSAEIDIEQTESSFAFIVEDDLPALSFHLYDNIWAFEQKEEFYPIETATAEDFQSLNNLFNAILGSLGAIESYLQKNPLELEEHATEIPSLSAIHKQLEIIAKSIPLLQTHDATAIKGINEAVELILVESHNLNDSFAKIHEKALKELQATIHYQTRERLFYLLLTFFVFILMGAILLYNAASYRRKTELAQASERRNALFVEAIQTTKIGVMIRDVQKKNTPVIFVNRAFTEITGYSLLDVIDKPACFLIGLHTDQAAAHRLRESFTKGLPATIDLLIYRKDNTPLWSEWHIGPVLQKDGKITHFVSLITDTSAARAGRESLRLAKEEAERAMTVKGHFLASMSHELRTPINGMLGVMDLLSDTILDAEQSKLVAIARSSSERLLGIVNDILDYSKIEAGKLELDARVFSLRQTVQEVLDLMASIASGKNVEIRTSIAAEVPDSLLSDSGRIRQILLNLVSNALKFTETGSVTIKVAHLLDQADHSQSLALLRFEVVDTGMGISMADQQKLFNEFTQVDRSYTRRFGGTGLGLAICKQLVKLLNGEIGVESRPGQGSKFWFMLPIQISTVAPQTTAPTTSRFAKSALSSRETDQPTPSSGSQEQPMMNPLASTTDHIILLVEDNLVNQLVATRYIQKAGYKVDVANTGVEALVKVKLTDYDAIFMDISMPEMDGLTATREIRALGGMHAETPIIALTAHVMRGDREQCIAAGMNDYLCKPLHFESLRKTLARWLPASPPINTAAMPELERKEGTTASAVEMISVYDPNVLKTLSNDLDNSMVLRITQVFLDDFGRRVERLKECLSANNLASIMHESHALKSSSASCGLMRFSEIMRLIEAASNKEEINKISLLANQLEEAYTQARVALSEGRKVFQTE